MSQGVQDGLDAVALLRRAKKGDRAARQRIRDLWVVAETLDLDGRPAVRRFVDEPRPGNRPAEEPAER